MCGRFTQFSKIEILKKIFKGELSPDLEDFDFKPRYNLAPSQDALTILNDKSNKRILQPLKWGMIPSWSKDGKGFINARCETAADKPTFRTSFKSKRLIIPADGFYEWKKEGKQKQPYYFRQNNGKPFALAGLYDTWRVGDEKITTFTILTTDANEIMNPIHNRMPVILLEEDYDEWLDVNQSDKEKLSRMLKPYPAERMEGYPVQTMVNSPTNDRPENIEPIQAG